MRKLEKVWVDQSSPHVKSGTGNEYVMYIVNDYTSHVWPIPLKQKSNAFDYLIAWECAHEHQTGLKVRTDITDNGKLKSNAMCEWLESRGTSQLFMPPYTSAHIGHIE